MDYGDLELLGIDDDGDEFEDIELLGEDELDEDDDELGMRIMIPRRAAPRRVRKVRTARGRTRRVVQSPRRAKLAAIRKVLVPNIPGSPRAGAREWSLGFPVQTFDAASGTALAAVAQPQRAFKGSRLVVDIARTGATATGLISIGTLFIGQVNQLVSAQPVGAGAFAPGAFHTTMSLDPATPGIDVTVGYLTSIAPGAADQIDVGTTLIGLALGG